MRSNSCHMADGTCESRPDADDTWDRHRSLHRTDRCEDDRFGDDESAHPRRNSPNNLSTLTMIRLDMFLVLKCPHISICFYPLDSYHMVSFDSAVLETFALDIPALRFVEKSVKNTFVIAHCKHLKP